MKKYGIENFHIELIEETSNPEEQEIYWIEQYRSFKNGYNATKGGDGKHYLDYDVLISAYQENPNISQISKIYHCDERHLSKILKNNNINIKTQKEVNQNKNGNIIHQYDKKGKYIKSFPSAGEALREVSPKTKSHGGVSHIMDVCKGKRKTAYGYIWKIAN
jgi:hypothetical protein